MRFTDGEHIIPGAQEAIAELRKCNCPCALLNQSRQKTVTDL
jgi:ribonucleotide monophosphatase NagD (HAD superfamily)